MQHAWAAGFFDGEGCIYLDKKRQHNSDGVAYQLAISITQKSRRPLARMHEMFGGLLRKDEKRGMYHWRLTGPSASNALALMLPHMSLKDEQARLAVEFQNTKYMRGSTRLTSEEIEYRERIFLRLREMKRESN